jgi:two-component system NtrC family sensor kinase
MNAIPVALALAALCWFLDSLIRVYVFLEGDLLQQLFAPELHQIWSRCVAVLLIMASGVYAHIRLTQRKRTEKGSAESRGSLRELVQQCTMDLAKAGQRLQRDITERKPLEEIFREDEEEYRSLVEGLNEAIYRASLPDGACEYISPAALPVFGYHAQDFFNEPMLLWRIIHPDFLEPLKQQWADSVEGSVPPIFEYKIIDSEGNERWIRQTSKALCDNQGHMVAIEGRCRNITEDKWTEEALRQVRDQVNRYLDLAGVMFLVLDTRGRLTLLNDKACKTLGYDRKDLLGKDWFGTCVPHRTRKDVSDIFKMLIAGETDAGEYYENPILTKNGEERIVEWHNSVLRGHDGGIIGVLSSGNDVTERRHHEEALRESEDRFLKLRGTAFDGAMIQENECLVEVNQALADMLGYDPSEMIGMHMSQLVTAESWELVQKDIRESSEKPYEATMVRKDGSTVPIEIVRKESIREGRRVSISAIRDITERKQTEEALRQSEKRFRDMAELSPQSLFEMDLEGKIVSANQQTREIYGYGPEDFERGLNGLQLFVPEERERLKSDLQRMITGENLSALEYTALRRDRTAFPILLYASPIVHDGKPAGIRGIAIDITQRKQAEETIQKSEANHRAILNAMPDRMFQVDADGTLRDIHTNDGKDWVTLPGAVLAKRVYDVFPTEVAKQIMDRIEKVLKGKDVPVLDYRMSLQTGELRDFEARFSACGEHTALVIARDITEHKRDEETLREYEANYRSLIDNLDAIYVLDGDKLVFMNRAFSEMFQFTEEEARTPDFTFSKMIAPRSRAFMMERQRMRETGETPPARYEFSALRKNGEEIELEVSENEIQYDGRTVFQCSVRDITDKKKSEVQWVLAQKMEAIDQLATGIAQQMNAPTQHIGDHTRFLKDAFSDITDLLGKYEGLLNAVKNERVTEDIIQEVEVAAEKVDYPYLKEEIPKAAEQALDAVKRVADIVGTMKEFSQPDRKEKEPVDINRALQSLISKARNEWKAVAKIVTELEPSLPMVRCRAGQTQQVFLNVIRNAAQAIADAGGNEPGKKGTITVSTRHDGDCVEVRIADTGTGIPENIRSKIFDPFFTTKGVGRGVGQGLAVAHSTVVNGHGGTITFETTEGKGTTFIIRLPIKEEVASERAR